MILGAIPPATYFCAMERIASFWERLYSWKVHHFVLWFCYYFFWVLLYRGFYPTLLPLLITTAIYLVFNALSFYIIAYYLVSKFISERRLVAFIFLAIAVIILCSSGLSMGLYLMFKNMHPTTDNFQFMVIGAFSSTVLTTSFLTAIKLMVEKIRSERTTKQVEKQRLESELQYLKAQVNPHFLFNAINSVYILIRKDPEKASETLIKLSDLLRFQLYDCSVDRIAIEKEMDYIQNYIGLEKLRKGEKINVAVSREGNLTGFQVAPFLLMPFLENAFKHVSNYPDQPNEISIGFKKNEKEFIATFYNTKEELPGNGVGGIGLKNVRRRLELLYPEKHTLNIEQNAGSFQATLQLTHV